MNETQLTQLRALMCTVPLADILEQIVSEIEYMASDAERDENYDLEERLKKYAIALSVMVDGIIISEQNADILRQ